MLDDFKTSINRVLQDRITSPFFGAFVFSWLVWNWKPLYMTFFVSESRIIGNKLDYIENEFASWNYQLVYPILSTLFLILVYPWFNTLTMWVMIKYRKVYTHIKQREENQILLSLEESVALRQQLQKREERIREMVSNKEGEIQQLRDQLGAERNNNDNKIANMQSNYDKALKDNALLEQEITLSRKELSECRSSSAKNIADLELRLSTAEEKAEKFEILRISSLTRESDIKKVKKQINKLFMETIRRTGVRAVGAYQIFKEIKASPTLSRDFEKLAPFAIAGDLVTDNISPAGMNFFKHKDLLIKMDETETYRFTDKGLVVYINLLTDDEN
jgi:hypothetical protein